MAERALLYLEDLHAGLRFECGRHALDAEQIKAFAREFDPQPFHLDEEAAKGTFFGGLAASGWHIVCLTMRMIAENIPIAGGLIGGAAEITWPQPTRPDDILHVTSQIMEVTPSRSKPTARHGPAAYGNAQSEGRIAPDLHRQMRGAAAAIADVTAPEAVLTGACPLCHLPSRTSSGRGGNPHRR